MADRLEISPSGPVQGCVRPPGSKSLTNRALICAALAEGASQLEGALDSEDTRVMAEALQQLGIQLTPHWQHASISVTGCGGQIPNRSADLFLANSGTSIRFLTAACTLGNGVYRLDGTQRMRQRPIGDLLHALRRLGADAESQLATGCPPVQINARGLSGGQATVRGDISSQFLSALLMAAPYARRPVEIVVQGPLVSRPYVDMTLAVMRAFGVDVTSDPEQGTFQIEPQRYLACRYEIEPDASAASYFFAAAAITGGEVTVEGLGFDVLQGDVRFVDCLRRMGCQVDSSAAGITVRGGPLRGIQVDMDPISDTVQTLAAVALFAHGPTTITGVGHIRHKETDRVGDLARELRKFGADVEERSDGLRIVPQTPLRGAVIETYNDHRMAMSLSLAGLRLPGVVIMNPSCTAKTYPGFFDDLKAICRPS